jgi:hypothetical protein
MKVYKPQEKLYGIKTDNGVELNQCFHCTKHLKCTESCDGNNFEQSNKVGNQLKENLKEQKKSAIKIGFIIVTIFVILGFGIFSGINSNHGNNSDFKAFIAAQEAVKVSLKSPSTAKFASFDTSDVIDMGDKYRINSYVDAENSYGAKVRVYYSAVVKSGSWTVETLETSE